MVPTVSALSAALDSVLRQLQSNDYNGSIQAIDNLIDIAKDKKGEIRAAEQKEQAEKRIEKINILRRQEEERRIAEEQESQAALEAHILDVTSMDLPLDWTNIYDTDVSTQGVFVESISDGYIKCLNNLGRVDIEYIASITGEEYKTIIDYLKGSIYQDPDKWGECFFKGWMTADEYLSGNIGEKLKTAKRATEEYHGYFDANVEALTKVLPESVSADQIYITLGSPWVPTDVISEFVMYLNEGIDYTEYIPIFSRRFDDKDAYSKFCKKYARRNYDSPTESYPLIHDEITGTWQWSGGRPKKWCSHDFVNRFGTDRLNPYDVLIKTLNMQSIAVYDSISSTNSKSGKQRVVNQTETTITLEKQNLLIEEFQKWVWTQPTRKERLEKIYNERYACTKVRHFDGSFLELPGLNPKFELFQYQKDAVARIMFSPNTLLAHDVGAGKTYVMIVAGMELKRIGVSEKNMYVVPNNILGQWKKLFLKLYPHACIKTIEAKDLNSANRKRTLTDIRDRDYDAIIITYSSFEKLTISNAYYMVMLDDEIEKQEQAIQHGSTSKLQNRAKKNKELRSELLFTADDPDEIYFNDLGITSLFVDEAHNFKNVPIDTKIDRVMGINKVGSKKCQDMMDKVHVIQRENNGRGIIFATGTPITNSITDAYIMQKYVQESQLELLGLQNFDSWVGMFAEKNTGFEVDVDTSNYRMATRFAKFHNIPELTNMITAFADFHSMAGNDDLPDFNGYKDVVIPKTAPFRDYLSRISERAEQVRTGQVPRTEDNMLLITTDGRKAALDMRLVDGKAAFTTDSKVFKCADTVYQIYKRGNQRNTTQLIFCDTSTPKEGFNIYDELKSLLVRMGIPENEIAFIHDATSEAKRQAIFSQVRAGGIRVLIGSTFKLGLGVNVQNRMEALHHLDVPWRPADMVQREGRILRQGNQNDFVEIYRYITEGSFDAYSWQLLETKQRFITDILGGVIEDREGQDVDDTVLNYAEVKALAVGNPLIKKRIEVNNELMKQRLLNLKFVKDMEKFSSIAMSYPGEIERLDRLRRLAMADEYYFAGFGRKYTEQERQEIRELIQQKVLVEEPLEKSSIIIEYQGFDIIAPAKVSRIHPVVYVQRAGKYRVEISDNRVSALLAIDRCLNTLTKRRMDLEKSVKEKREFYDYACSQVDNENPYSSKLYELERKLDEIDSKLGVDKEK